LKPRCGSVELENRPDRAVNLDQLLVAEVSDQLAQAFGGNGCDGVST
jgi:hypothetical protein